MRGLPGSGLSGIIAQRSGVLLSGSGGGSERNGGGGGVHSWTTRGRSGDGGGHSGSGDGVLAGGGDDGGAVSDLFGALRNRPVARASDAFRTFDLTLSLPQLPEPAPAAVRAAARRGGHGGGGVAGEGGDDGDDGASAWVEDDDADDSWGDDGTRGGGDAGNGEYGTGRGGGGGGGLWSGQTSLTARVLRRHEQLGRSHAHARSRTLQRFGANEGGRGPAMSALPPLPTAAELEATSLGRAFGVPAAGWDAAMLRVSAMAGGAGGGGGGGGGGSVGGSSLPSVPRSWGSLPALSWGTPVHSAATQAPSQAPRRAPGPQAPGVEASSPPPLLDRSLAPAPLVSREGVGAFEACYRAAHDHELNRPELGLRPIVLPTATLARLALQVAAGTPAPPFVVLGSAERAVASPGLVPSGAPPAACAAFVSNWTLVVAAGGGGRCRAPGTSTASVASALAQFALAGTAAHRLGCFVSAFAAGGSSSGSGSGSGGLRTVGQPLPGQVVQGVALAAGRLLEAYRLGLLAVHDQLFSSQHRRRPDRGRPDGGGGGGAAASGGVNANPNSSEVSAAPAVPTLAAVLAGSRRLRASILRLAHLCGCAAFSPLSGAARGAAAAACDAGADPGGGATSSSSYPLPEELHELAFASYPRGARLLSSLYERAVLEDTGSEFGLGGISAIGGGGGVNGVNGVGGGDAGVGSERLATALLVSGLRPYLALCSRWLLGRPLTASHDPAGEFPLAASARFPQGNLYGAPSSVTSAAGSFGGSFGCPFGNGSGDASLGPLAAHGGGAFFRRAFAVRGLAVDPARASSSSSMNEVDEWSGLDAWLDSAARAASSSSSSYSSYSYSSVVALCGVRDAHAVAELLRGELPSFLGFGEPSGGPGGGGGAAGPALLRAGMVLRLVGLTADSDHALFLDPNARSGGASLGLSLDLGPHALARAEAFVGATRSRARRVAAAVAGKAQAAAAAAAAARGSQVARARAAAAHRSAARLAEAAEARRAKRAKQDAQKTKLDAMVADNARRRSAAASEAAAAEDEAAKAKAAKRAALEAEAVEQLLDK